MKKIFIFLFFVLFISHPVVADKLPDFKYKNIKDGENIYYNYSTGAWSLQQKDSDIYFTKARGFAELYDYEDANGNFAFATDSIYEFIYNNRLIGYSNKDLIFYRMLYINGRIRKMPMSKEEVQRILTDYKVIGLSEFSKNTHSYKIKKGFGKLKILIYNDIDMNCDDYSFSTGNAKIETFDIRGALYILDEGMIQFSSDGLNSGIAPWFILLVR